MMITNRKGIAPIFERVIEVSEDSWFQVGVHKITLRGFHYMKAIGLPKPRNSEYYTDHHSMYLTRTVCNTLDGELIRDLQRSENFDQLNEYYEPLVDDFVKSILDKKREWIESVLREITLVTIDVYKGQFLYLFSVKIRLLQVGSIKVELL